ncbi:hypothetical protein DL95DRAFT_32175 [Leptodontidium sp. 2 PMI_412]|nr:hypothetical protein DL95DRAFT_32175 [Leptodontidium sp. 2 PMI_412]
MAEVLATVASVMAVIQISDRVIGLCKFYIESLNSEAPSSLRAVLIEVSTLKTVVESLEFLSKCVKFTPALQKRLWASDGPVEGCRAAITALEKLFPKGSAQSGQNVSKRQKVRAALEVLAWPMQQGRVQELLQQISSHKAGIQLALTTESTQDIKDIKAASKEIRSILAEEQRHNVYKWLTLTDPSPLHNRSWQLYEQGTGSWMLRSPHWTDWLAASIRCLWVHGIPGAGKTILASWLIKQVQDHCKQSSKMQAPCTSAYYYCYFGHSQDEAMPFLRWVIAQLSRQAEVVSTLVHDLFRRGGEPSIQELLDSLAQLLQSFGNVYIVIDAVDESNPRDNLLEVIHTLVTDPRFSHLQILVTSREYIEIERVMEKISISVPMSNSLVEQDIRIYVRSILQSNRKFQPWSNDLLKEVEDAVSTQAKGMFRWAVCQLYELQHVKGERSVVRNALATLPKDLDETYERIFLRIPKEELQFVCHAFQWLCFYGELGAPENGTPSVLLLDAIASSTARTGNPNSNVLYDSERLRELCGCLISSFGDAISFAHYTVKEYLDSARIRQSPLSFFSTEMAKVLFTCLDVVLLQAQKFTSSDLEDLKTASSHPSCWQDLWTKLSFHCAFYAITSIRRWGQEISVNDAFFGRVKALLDPSAQYFRRLQEVDDGDTSEMWRILIDDDSTMDQMAWTIVWNESATDNDASVLLSLLLITDDLDSPISTRMFREADLKALFNNRLALKKCTWMMTYDDEEGSSSSGVAKMYEFNGPLMEVMSQFVDYHLESFRSLLINYTRFYNPSTTLLYFIGRHIPALGDQSACNEDTSDCPVRKLLEAGAQPNLLGYRLTPLQIAVAARDLEGVRLLLQFKADPNYVGDPNGVVWSTNNLLANFNKFCGMSPLRICRSGDCVWPKGDYRKDAREPFLETIEQLLLAFGGIEFDQELKV